MMKVKRSRQSDIFHSNTNMPAEMNKGDTNKKQQKRKSFHGLSLKPLFNTDSRKVKHPDEEKVSLLKRFGSRRMSKKKAKKSVSSSDSDYVAVSEGQSHSQDDAGHTPKTRRIHQINSSRVYKMLEHSPWGSEDSEADDTAPTQPKVKRSHSLRDTGRRLRRSMSLLCASSRSKLLHSKSTDGVQPEKRRQSLGTGMPPGGSVAQDHKDCIPGRTLELQECLTDQENSMSLDSVLLDFNVRNNGSTPENSFCCEKTPTTARRISALRRRSEGTALLSAKTSKLKRCSYKRMTLDQDSSSLENGKVQRKSSAGSEADGDRSTPRRTRSLKRTWSSFKISNKKSENDPVARNTADKPLSRKDSLRRSTRRKSLGSALSPQERRGSGVYASANTPTFMTCGYIMTDSPPDRDHSTDLPWVTLKRKRRSEMSDNCKVNRYNAGHTPVPVRKKRCSYGERLIE